VVCYEPRGHWHTNTFIAALRHDGIKAPWLLEGAMNGDAFLTYVRRVLGPTLRKGDIVVLDNLSSHKVEGVRQAVEARGATILYLPPYSPDFNPIEKFFSKLKSLLRKAAPRSLEPPTLHHPQHPFIGLIHRMPQLLRLRWLCARLNRNRSKITRSVRLQYF
jgi:transposase